MKRIAPCTKLCVSIDHEKYGNIPDDAETHQAQAAQDQQDVDSGVHRGHSQILSAYIKKKTKPRTKVI